MKAKTYRCAYANTQLCPSCLHEGPMNQPCAYCKDAEGWFIEPHPGQEGVYWHVRVAQADDRYWKSFVRMVGQTSTQEFGGRTLVEAKQQALNWVHGGKS
jgi:hypothetical protein